MLLRAILLLLLCMNLGVAAWWASQREAPPRAPAATEPGIPGLRLLSEVERRPLDDAAAELAEAPAPLSADVRCLSLGPFETPADLRRAMDRLLPRVERIQFREVPAVALRGYRVYLPPAGSRQEALQVARALSSQGISDYYVVTAGPQRNTVSLGLFRDLANATQRRDAVAALGYTPTVEPRTETVSQWWIDLAAAPGFDWQALLEAPNLRAETTSCR
jgi:hypothetical protein